MTVFQGTVASRGYNYSTTSLAWEAASTGGGGAAASTVVTISTVQGVVTLAAASTGVTVTPAAGSTFNVRALNSSAADLLMTASPAGGSTWNVRALNPSAADLQMTATPAGGSTWNVRALNSSAADFLCNVSSVAGLVTLAATSTGVTVTPAGGSTFNVRALNSTAADLLMTASPSAGSTWNCRVLNSSAADLLMTASPSAGSTWNVRALNSSAADLLMTASPAAGSTWNVRPLQSSASDLKMSAFLFDSTGNLIETSTFAASTKTSTVRGLMVRQAVPDCTSAGAVIATAGDNTMISSGTGSIYCYALSLIGEAVNVASTVAQVVGSSGIVVRIQNGTTSANLWRQVYRPSTITQSMTDIAVTPPCYLFKTGPGNLLNLNATSTGGGYSVACWRE